jgi:broad specificity phosphatase PhoE
MGWPRLLVLVRHAESQGNVLTVDERANYETPTHAYGLTERGRLQAEIAGEDVARRWGGFNVHYVSYYARSRETMAIMCPKARVYEDPRLAEAQRGVYHAMTREELRERMPWEIVRKDREGLYHYRPPGGENWADVELRIHSFLGTLSRDCDDLKVLMVVHGHWLLLFQRLIHHFSIEDAVEKYKKGVAGGGIYENCSLTVYASERVGKGDRLKLVEENAVPWRGIIE